MWDPKQYVYGASKGVDAKAKLATKGGAGSGSGGGGAGTAATPMPGDGGLVGVTWRYRATPWGIAFDAVTADGEVLMSNLYPDATKKATWSGFTNAWPRLVPVVRAALYGVIVSEVFLAALLGAYVM